MHIQRICGQSRLVTHCVLEGLGICLTIAPRVGTVKLARVGRSLLEPDATGERAVRLPPTAPGPFNLAFLPPSRAKIFDYCQASRWKLFGSYLRRRRKSVSSLAMESDGKVLGERKRLEKSEETLFCYFQRHFVFHHVCSFEKCSDGPLSRILHTMNRYIDRRCRTSMLRFFIFSFPRLSKKTILNATYPRRSCISFLPPYLCPILEFEFASYFNRVSPPKIPRSHSESLTSILHMFSVAWIMHSCQTAISFDQGQFYTLQSRKRLYSLAPLT